MFSRKSHLRTFLQYREYVGRHLYKQHLGLSAALLVLNVTTDAGTQASMIKLVQDLSPKGNSYMLFRTEARFGRYFKPQAPMLGLLSEPWRRAGAGDLVIGASLG